MKKLYLFVISLSLCLILGFGSLAAQKGKKKEPQTTFDVSVVDGDDPKVTWWAPDCVGEAEGSHLDAHFPLLSCAPVGANFRLLQISLNITRKSVGLHIFFRDPSGNHLQSDDISLPPEAVKNVSYTAFDVVVNAEGVPIREEHQGKPGSGPVKAEINVGEVRYVAQTP